MKCSYVSPKKSAAVFTMLFPSLLMAASNGYILKKSQDAVNPAGADSLPAIRSDFFKLNPLLDHQKPVGKKDYAGWIENQGLLIGSPERGWIAGLSLKGLSPKWWLKTPEDLSVPPFAQGSFVILAFRDGSVWKVNSVTGQTIWTRSVDSFVAKKIILSEDRLLAFTASQSLYSLDYATGDINWVHDGNQSEDLVIRDLSPPTAHRGKIYYGQPSGEITALDEKTGQHIWTHAPTYQEARFHDVIGEIIPLDPILLLSRYDGQITALSLANPKKEIWAKPVNLSSVTATSFRHGRLYVGTHSGTVHALNPKNGIELWKTDVGTSVESLSAGESSLYTVSSKGRISAINVDTGKVHWIDDLGGGVLAHPIYVGNKIYFQTSYMNFYGYNF